jgi:5-carboxymethyl-2-hydroxymuconic-semialdehyde dehydrogenase
MDKVTPKSSDVDFYMETKHVSLARGAHKIQRLGVPSS